MTRMSVRTIQRYLARGVVESEPFRKTGRDGPGPAKHSRRAVQSRKAFHAQGDPAKRASVNEYQTQSGEFLAIAFLRVIFSERRARALPLD